MKNNSGTAIKDRRVDLDFMRILACFLVIFNHTCGYHAFLNAGLSGGGLGTLKIWILMTAAMLTRINVPLFFIISGTLLLREGKNESYKLIFLKRILRVILVLMLFTFMLYIISIRGNIGSFSITRYIRYVLAKPSDIRGNAYWYLYSYIGFLIALPLLRKIAPNLSRQDFYVLIGVHFFWESLVPMTNVALNMMGKQSISICSDVSSALGMMLSKPLFYPLIGYYIDRKIDIESISKSKLALLMTAALFGIILSDACTYYQGTHGEMTFTQNYVQLFDYLTTICAFITVKYIFSSYVIGCTIYDKIAKLITCVGTLTFGIYLLDPMISTVLYNYVTAGFVGTCIPESVIWCMASMVIGGGITFIAKKFKIFRLLL